MKAQTKRALLKHRKLRDSDIVTHGARLAERKLDEIAAAWCVDDAGWREWVQEIFYQFVVSRRVRKNNSGQRIGLATKKQRQKLCKAAEELLRFFEGEGRQLLEAIPDPQWLQTPNHRFHKSNEARSTWQRANLRAPVQTVRPAVEVALWATIDAARQGKGRIGRPGHAVAGNDELVAELARVARYLGVELTVPDPHGAHQYQTPFWSGVEIFLKALPDDVRVKSTDGLCDHVRENLDALMSHIPLRYKPEPFLLS